MHFMQYILPVLLSCFTGWLVIWLTVTLLFRPHKPAAFAGITIQGFLPANQQLIAEKIGRLVSTEFFSFAALEKKAADPENFLKLKPEIETHIDSFLKVRLKETFPMLSMFVGDKTINQLKSAFLHELETLFPVLMTRYISNLQQQFDIEKQVTDVLAGLSISKTEEMLFKSAKKQWAKLQLLGAGIGFFAGMLHIFLNTQLFG